MKRIIATLTVVTALAGATPALASGWFLLSPPAQGDAVYDQAPLSSWQQMKSFDDAESCEANLARVVAWADGPDGCGDRASLSAELARRGQRSLTCRAMQQRVDANICVPSDDPRLAR